MKSMKKVKCKGCKNTFVENRYQQKFCSIPCFNKFQTRRKPTVCVICKKTFDPYGLRKMKYCSRTCYGVDLSKKRIGKKNPAFRNGSRINGKNDFDSRKTQKYRTSFYERTTYPYCEVCFVNSSFRWEVHHIIFRSEMPRHKKLHDDRNLIHVCIQCHNAFHASSGKEKRKPLIFSRNLEELFDKKFL